MNDLRKISHTEELQLVVLPGNGSTSHVEHYESAWQHWHTVWLETFRSQDGVSHIFSDNFLRQDEIVALFLADQCVALVCHRYVNISLTSARNDSYFEGWAPGSLEAVRQDGPNIAIINQSSVLPEFRGQRVMGFALRELVAMLSLTHLYSIPVDAATAAVRSDRNMHSMCYALGAVALQANVNQHNSPVDLVAFYPRRKGLTLTSEANQLVEDLVKRKLGGFLTTPTNDLRRIPNAA